MAVFFVFTMELPPGLVASEFIEELMTYGVLLLSPVILIAGYMIVKKALSLL